MRSIKKQTILPLLAILVLLGLGWFVVKKKGSEKTVPDDATAVATTTITLDYSKLIGKDRLYTEEEGKYENLSEEEKKVVRLALWRSETEQREFDKMSYDEGKEIGRSFKRERERDLEETVLTSSLVALKNEYALVTFLTTKGRHHSLYNLEQRKVVGDFGGVDVRNDQVIIFPRERGLFYYKPGMNDFLQIEKSLLTTVKESYYSEDGSAPQIDGKIIDDRLVISIFGWEFLSPPNEYSFKKLREAKFDLSALP